MPVDYTPAPSTYHDVVQLMSDGDNNDASNFSSPLEAALDNAAYIKNLNHVATVTRWMRNARWNADQWVELNVIGAEGGWVAAHVNDSATVEVLFIPVEIPQSSTITQVQIHVDPGTTHPNLPAVMPRWELQSWAPPGFITLLESETDSSANVAAFEAPHTIGKIVSVGPINSTTTLYRLAVYCEAGANSRTAFRVTGARITFTTTKVDEGGA